MTNEERIIANAEIVIRTFGAESSIVLDYDQESVEWIDGYIEANRGQWDEDTAERMGSVLGSFLGECIRTNFGGVWEMTENGLGVMFDDQNGVFPFNKINKQIENGAEDSIASFYSSILALRSINYA